jgi:hypothetical protein
LVPLSAACALCASSAAAKSCMLLHASHLQLAPCISRVTCRLHATSAWYARAVHASLSSIFGRGGGGGGGGSRGRPSQDAMPEVHRAGSANVRMKRQEVDQFSRSRIWRRRVFQQLAHIRNLRLHTRKPPKR